MNHKSNKELAGRKKMKVTGFIFLYYGLMMLVASVMNAKYALANIQASSVGFFKLLFTKPYPTELIEEIMFILMAIIFIIHGFFSVKYSDRFDRTTTCLVTSCITAVICTGVFVISAKLEESTRIGTIIVASVMMGIPFLINLKGAIQNKRLIYKESPLK